MVIAVILVTYFIDHVLDRKYPWIWPSLLCASGFGICCSTYLFLDMPIIDTWIFLFPLSYSVFFFSNSLKAAIPWTRRRSAGAASASSPPSPEEGTEYFIRKGIVPETEGEVYEYGFAITICTIASTLGLLLGQFLGGAVLIVILHLSVLRRGVPRLHAPALLPDDVRRAPGRARLLAPPLPALGAGGPRRPAHPAPQQAVSAGEQEGADPALGPLLPVRQGALQARVLNEKFNRSSIFFGILKRESTGRCWRARFARGG